MNETVMIVDDSSFIKDGLVTIFKREGYTTISATSGDECLEILKTTTPDIIILDILMEPMDGWETLNRLKAHPATAGIPVLMFSAKKISPSEALEHRKDIEGVVTKPVNPVQLIHSIQRILNHRNHVNVEEFVAPGVDLDKALVEEYAALHSGIEVDKDLLVILKNSTGANTPGHVVPAEDLAALQNLEEKIRVDEQRLKEISETRTIPPKPSDAVSHSIEPLFEELVPATEPAPVAEPIPESPVTPAIPVIVPSVTLPETPSPSVIPVPHEIQIQPPDTVNHSIEPLFEDPVPITEPAPVTEPIPESPVTSAIPVIVPSVTLPETPSPSVIPVPHEIRIQPPDAVNHSIEPLFEDPVPATEPIPRREREIPVSSFATSPGHEISAVTPAPVSQPLPPMPGFRPNSVKPGTSIIAVVIIVILVIAVGVFVLLKFL